MSDKSRLCCLKLANKIFCVILKTIDDAGRQERYEILLGEIT